MWWSQIKIRQLFSPAHIPHFAYLSFTSMYIPPCQISSSICRLISHWCLIPITFLSLSQLRIFHLLPLWQHLAVLPLCLHSILTSLPVLSSLTTPSLYIYIHSFAIASVVFLASDSTTQFLSVKASSSLLLIFFNLPNFKVWWLPIDHVKLARRHRCFTNFDKPRLTFGVNKCDNVFKQTPGSSGALFTIGHLF